MLFLGLSPLIERNSASQSDSVSLDCSIFACISDFFLPVYPYKRRATPTAKVAALQSGAWVVTCMCLHVAEMPVAWVDVTHGSTAFVPSPHFRPACLSSQSTAGSSSIVACSDVPQWQQPWPLSSTGFPRFYGRGSALLSGSNCIFIKPAALWEIATCLVSFPSLI